MRFLIRSCGTFNFHFLFEQITAEWTSDTSDAEFMSIPIIDATKIVSSKTNDKIVLSKTHNNSESKINHILNNCSSINLQ